MRNRRADHSPWFFGMETKLCSGHLSMVGPFGFQVATMVPPGGMLGGEEPFADAGDGHLL